MKIQKHSSIISLANDITMRLGYAGYAVVGESWKTHQLATPFNRLYLIESGTGMLSGGSEELTLEPGKAYLLPAGLPCSYHCNGSLSLLFFHFNLSQPDQFDLMQSVSQPTVVDLPPTQFALLRQVCEQSGYTDAFEVICAINNIVLEMNRKYAFNWDNRHTYSKRTSDVIAIINQNLSSQLRIDALAQQCYISKSYLARQFRQEVGMTIKQYINMQLVKTAQWRLSHSADSVEKVSSDLGFCNQFYFSEFFKSHCRVSPLQYRHGTKY